MHVITSVNPNVRLSLFLSYFQFYYTISRYHYFCYHAFKEVLFVCKCIFTLTGKHFDSIRCRKFNTWQRSSIPFIRKLICDKEKYLLFSLYLPRTKRCIILSQVLFCYMIETKYKVMTIIKVVISLTLLILQNGTLKLSQFTLLLMVVKFVNVQGIKLLYYLKEYTYSVSSQQFTGTLMLFYF